MYFETHSVRNTTSILQAPLLKMSELTESGASSIIIAIADEAINEF